VKESLFIAAGGDAELAHIARFSSFAVELASTSGRVEWVRVARGVVDGSPAQAGDDVLRLRADDAVWRELVDADAAPRRHDLLSLTKVADGIDIVEGRTTLIRHLRVINRLVEIAKRLEIGENHG
jgi:hypothetical protein